MTFHQNFIRHLQYLYPEEHVHTHKKLREFLLGLGLPEEAYLDDYLDTAASYVRKYDGKKGSTFEFELDRLDVDSTLEVFLNFMDEEETAYSGREIYPTDCRIEGYLQGIRDAQSFRVRFYYSGNVAELPLYRYFSYMGMLATELEVNTPLLTRNKILTKTLISSFTSACTNLLSFVSLVDAEKGEKYKAEVDKAFADILAYMDKRIRSKSMSYDQLCMSSDIKFSFDDRLKYDR